MIGCWPWMMRRVGGPRIDEGIAAGEFLQEEYELTRMMSVVTNANPRDRRDGVAEGDEAPPLHAALAQHQCQCRK